MNKSYLNISGNLYDSEYINLANVKDKKICMDERTLFLSEEEKNALNLQKICEFNNVLYLFKLNNIYGIVCDVPISEYKEDNIKCHELVIPETIQGMISNLNGYNCEVAPVLLGHTNKIDYSKYINNKLYDEKFVFNDLEIYVMSGEEADEIINKFRSVKCLYVADGHHRLYSTSLSNIKKENLACLISFEYLNILPIHRIIKDISKESYMNAKQFINNKFKVLPSDEELLKGRVKIKYRDDNFIVELIELNSDPFWNNDIYRLNTQIISQAFRIFDNTRIEYLSTEELCQKENSLLENEILIETYPVSQEEFIESVDNNCIMPPKSTWFSPKFPSFLIFKAYQ